MNYEQVKTRYENNYITDEQLKKFVQLGIITQEQYDALWAAKHADDNKQ